MSESSKVAKNLLTQNKLVKDQELYLLKKMFDRAYSTLNTDQIAYLGVPEYATFVEWRDYLEYCLETERQAIMTDETTAVVGEEIIDTSGVEVKEIPLVKAGLYPATFHGVSIHCGREWNSVPNVNLIHKLKDTNRMVFSSMLMGMHPDKNGQLNIQRKNGLKAFLKVLGTEIEKLRVIKKVVDNPKDGSKVELKYCDAEQVKTALEQYVKQAEYRIRVTERAAENGFPAKNDVFEFLPKE